MSRRPSSDGVGENQADLFGARAPHARELHSTRRAKSPPPADAARTGVSANTPVGLLNVRQAAARLGLSKSTLDKMRGAGKGPRFIKSTDRAIRYDPVDLDRWISARRSGN